MTIRQWLRVALFGIAAAYLWRSAIFPADDEPRGRFDRGLRIFGAILLTVIVIYFIAYGFGLFDPFDIRQK